MFSFDINISCGSFLSSHTTNPNPFKSSNVPTILSVPFSSIFVICPSALLPFEASPVILTSTLSLCIAPIVYSAGIKISPSPSSGVTNPNPRAFPVKVPAARFNSLGSMSLPFLVSMIFPSCISSSAISSNICLSLPGTSKTTHISPLLSGMYPSLFIKSSIFPLRSCLNVSSINSPPYTLTCWLFL